MNGELRPMKTVAVMRNRFHADTQKLKIGLLYLFLGAGGLWHVLQIFQEAMQQLAPLTIAGLAVWLLWEYGRSLSNRPETNSAGGRTARERYRLVGWAGLVFAGSVGVEWLGIRTGRIFGEYAYGKTLYPALDGVPVAIGFAWLGMLMAAIAVMQKALKGRFRRNAVVAATVSALLMVIFDLFMEQAAVELGYWMWRDDQIPLQNYLAWFWLSFVFSYAGLRLAVFRRELPALAFHAYFAQLLYFVLVNLG